jgi:predicted Ser/Thr protein kinase
LACRQGPGKINVGPSDTDSFLFTEVEYRQMDADRSRLPSPSGTALGSPPAPAVPPNREPDSLPLAIGKYKVLGLLGAGAMGVVYKCSQPGLGRPVAVKVMIAGRHASTEQIRRFQREAWAAAQLAHPNILHVYDIGTEEEIYYFVMEYVDGGSLERLIGTPELTVEHSLRLLAHIARALQAAHSQGIVHRDVKPSNILLQGSGQPKLSDFGLAKVLAAGHNLSGSGDLIGTPRYMSPEQALAAPEEVDAQTDIYSLGAVLYEALTGRPPFDGPSIMSVLRKLSDEEPPPVRELNPAVPEEVAAVCRRAMAKDKAARFASTGELADALEACLGRGPVASGAAGDEKPPHRLPRRWAVGGIGAGVALLGLLAWGAWLAAHTSSPGGSPPTEPKVMEPAEQPPDSDDPEPQGQPPAPEEVSRAAGVVQKARTQLGDRLALAPGGLGTIMRSLSTVVGRQPELPQKTEALFLRGQAHRRAGEYYSAVEDLTQVLQRHPADPAALTERLLAEYQLHVLYLGNLNEGLLRPYRLGRVQADADLLARQADPTRKYIARLVLALARHDFTEAAKAVAAAPPRVPPEYLPEVKMLEADALFHWAEVSYAAAQAAPEGPEREAKQREHEAVAKKAHVALRRGLEADRNNVGLLFLKADVCQRPAAAWDAPDNEDRAAIMRRHRWVFDEAFSQLRQVAPLSEYDNYVARAVLFMNSGKEREALLLVNEALSLSPTLPYLYVLKAWLRLQSPPAEVGVVTDEEAAHILREFAPAFDPPPEDFNAHYLRALVRAAAGEWDDARENLRVCKRKLASRPLPTTDDNWQQWLKLGEGPRIQYLDHTQNILWWYLPVTVDLRIKLSDELLRLAATPQEGVKPEELKEIKGRAHFNLAKAYAGKENKEAVLRNIREALRLKLPSLKPSDFRQEGTFNPYNGQPEFEQLYKEFEKR